MFTVCSTLLLQLGGGWGKEGKAGCDVLPSTTRAPPHPLIAREGPSVTREVHVPFDDARIFSNALCVFRSAVHVFVFLRD